MFSILVVDDSRTNRMLLKKLLTDSGYAVLEADGGKQTLQLLESHIPDLILLDVMMPGLSGFDLCRILKEHDTTRRIPVVFLTSLDRTEDKVKALELGAVDFISKPFSPAEVLARVRNQAEMHRMYCKIMENNQRMAEDLETARRVQRNFLPAHDMQLPGITFRYIYEPCDELGGDLFNIVKLPDNRILMYMSDVAGHGVAASLLTIFTDTFFSSKMGTDNQPGTMLTEFNAHFFREKITEKHIVIFLAVLDPEAHELQWSSAGQSVAPVLFGPDRCTTLEMASFPIGLIPYATFEEHSIDWHPGDTLLLYSDGITDVEDTKGQPALTEDQLISLIRTNRDKTPDFFINTVMTRIQTAVPDQNYPDDLTLCLISREVS